jgi:hypothetical protein
MKRVAALVTISIALSGCLKEPETSIKAGSDFLVERLFTVDGCTFYRFKDGSYRYFTNCSGSTSWEESGGKSNLSKLTGVQGGKP